MFGMGPLPPFKLTPISEPAPKVPAWLEVHRHYFDALKSAHFFEGTGRPFEGEPLAGERLHRARLMFCTKKCILAEEKACSLRESGQCADAHFWEDIFWFRGFLMCPHLGQRRQAAIESRSTMDTEICDDFRVGRCYYLHGSSAMNPVQTLERDSSLRRGEAEGAEALSTGRHPGATSSYPRKGRGSSRGYFGIPVPTQLPPPPTAPRLTPISAKQPELPIWGSIHLRYFVALRSAHLHFARLETREGDTDFTRFRVMKCKTIESGLACNKVAFGECYFAHYFEEMMWFRAHKPCSIVYAKKKWKKGVSCENYACLYMHEHDRNTPTMKLSALSSVSLDVEAAHIRDGNLDRNKKTGLLSSSRFDGKLDVAISTPSVGNISQPGILASPLLSSRPPAPELTPLNKVFQCRPVWHDGHRRYFWALLEAHRLFRQNQLFVASDFRTRKCRFSREGSCSRIGFGECFYAHSFEELLWFCGHQKCPVVYSGGEWRNDAICSEDRRNECAFLHGSSQLTPSEIVERELGGQSEMGDVLARGLRRRVATVGGADVSNTLSEPEASARGQYERKVYPQKVDVGRNDVDISSSGRESSDEASTAGAMTMKDWKRMESVCLSAGGPEALAFKMVRDTMLQPSFAAEFRNLENASAQQICDFPVVDASLGYEIGELDDGDQFALKNAACTMRTMLDPFHDADCGDFSNLHTKESQYPVGSVPGVVHGRSCVILVPSSDSEGESGAVGSRSSSVNRINGSPALEFHAKSVATDATFLKLSRKSCPALADFNSANM